MASVVETFVLCLFVCKFSNFFLFHPPLFIQYSTEECSTVQLLARDPEYPQRIRVALVFETFDCLLVLCVSANFLIARSPEYPQRIKVGSVFEPCA